MACDKKQRVGRCNHAQCPFPGETSHGYECVDVQGGYCEMGEDCLEKCPLSFEKKDADKAMKAFEDAYPIDLPEK